MASLSALVLPTLLAMIPAPGPTVVLATPSGLLVPPIPAGFVARLVAILGAAVPSALVAAIMPLVPPLLLPSLVAISPILMSRWRDVAVMVALVGRIVLIQGLIHQVAHNGSGEHLPQVPSGVCWLRRIDGGGQSHH